MSAIRANTKTKYWSKTSKKEHIDHHVVNLDARASTKKRLSKCSEAKLLLKGASLRLVLLLLPYFYSPDMKRNILIVF